MTLFRGIVQGPPGSGKTSLACALAKAGYRVIRCGFEPGEEVFRAYCDEAARARIHDLIFEDSWELEDERLKRVPTGMNAFESFIYKGSRELGTPRDWGSDTVLFIDTLTSMGNCAEAREETVTTTNMGAAAWEADKAIISIAKYMTSPRRTYHTVWLSHLRLLSPKVEAGYMRGGQLVTNETQLQVQVKRERAQLEETAYYPSCITGSVARNFVGNFPFSLLTEELPKAVSREFSSQRVVRTKPLVGYTIKCPLEVEDKLPIETALVTIFEGLTRAGPALHSSDR